MVDIIMPAYNSHNTIVKAISSVATQTYRNQIRLYIVDDCSDYGYDEQIAVFKDLLNIKVFRLDKNSGPGVARAIWT